MVPAKVLILQVQIVCAADHAALFWSNVTIIEAEHDAAHTDEYTDAD